MEKSGSTRRGEFQKSFSFYLLSDRQAVMSTPLEKGNPETRHTWTCTDGGTVVHEPGEAGGNDD